VLRRDWRALSSGRDVGLGETWGGSRRTVRSFNGLAAWGGDIVRVEDVGAKLDIR
jgi:hypothetical protein